MRTPLLSLTTAIVMLFSASDTRAQCPGPASMNFSNSGEVCANLGPTLTLSGTYDPATCQMRIRSHQNTYSGWKATHWLLLGQAPLTPAVPIHRARCLLQVAPIVALPGATRTTQDWFFTVPALLPGTTFPMQSLAIMNNPTVSFSHVNTSAILWASVP